MHHSLNFNPTYMISWDKQKSKLIFANFTASKVGNYINPFRWFKQECFT